MSARATRSSTRSAATAAPIDEDVVLLQRVGAGNLDALGQLFDRHEADVRRLVRRLGVQPSDVDDLVQLTFLDLARSAERFDPSLSLRSWLLGIAAMTVRRHRRSLSRWITNFAGRVYESRRAPPSTPSQDLEREQDLARFEQAIARLPDKRREVFVLVAIEEMSGEAAAAVLGIPVATVWTRLHYARKELRALLEDGE